MDQPITNTQLPIEPPITPPVITSPPASQKSLVLPILISVVILTLVGAVGYLGFQVYRLNKIVVIDNTPAPTPDLSAEASAKEDPTTNWKTYSIPQLKITLKLPPNLAKLGSWKTEIVPGDTGSNVCFHIPTTQSFLIKPVHAGGVGLCNGNQKFIVNAVTPNFTAGRGPGFTDISGYKENQGKFYSSDNTTPIDSTLVQKVTNSNNVTYLRILGKNTKDDNWPSPGTPGKGYVAAIINTQNSEYPGINIVMQLDDQLTQELFDQILSTFKLTSETEKTTSTQDWKTFTNQTQKIKISYPSDWQVDSSKIEDDEASMSISKNEYKITIYWPSAFGPGICIFDDESRENASEMANFCKGKFVEFTSNDKTQTHRRLVEKYTDKTNHVTVYTKDPQGAYVTVPPMGYDFPTSPDEKILETMDSIIATWKLLE